MDQPRGSELTASQAHELAMGHFSEWVTWQEGMTIYDLPPRSS